MAGNTTLAPRQGLLDIAIRELGSPEAVFDIAISNGLSITDSLPAGASITIPATSPSRIASAYQSLGINPATELSALDFANTVAGEGIEFWAIETDFIVS